MLRQALFYTPRLPVAFATAKSASRMVPKMTTTRPGIQQFARPGAFASVRFISDEIKSAIESAVASAPVVLFMKGTPEAPACGFSRATIQILGYQGVDPDKFAAYNVLEDPELRSGIKEFSNWPTIPQLYINKEFIGGHDIIVSMSQSGELAELLEKENVLVPEEEEEGQARA